jgi:hypothetical protein
VKLEAYLTKARKSVSTTKKAGVVFPVLRILKKPKKGSYASRILKGANGASDWGPWILEWDPWSGDLFLGPLKD